MGEKVAVVGHGNTAFRMGGDGHKTVGTTARRHEQFGFSRFLGYKDGKGKVYPGKGKPKRALENAELSELGLPYDVYMIITPGGLMFPPALGVSHRVSTRQKMAILPRPKVLGRPLSTKMSQFSAIIRRLSALVLLEKELNKNYHAAKNHRHTGEK